MSLIDKITGRAKKAAGDLTGDSSLHRQGRQEERKGEAKEELARDQRRADAKADELPTWSARPRSSLTGNDVPRGARLAARNVIPF